MLWIWCERFKLITDYWRHVFRFCSVKMHVIISHKFCSNFRKHIFKITSKFWSERSRKLKTISEFSVFSKILNKTSINAYTFWHLFLYTKQNQNKYMSILQHDVHIIMSILRHNINIKYWRITWQNWYAFVPISTCHVSITISEVS